ncbi:MAG TPA: uroporphyrinogen-III C-methyltransferase [Anaerolineales bacterium]|nr:uroporphyrinogen-III C-methyltransferase [Anaerolineales bacterium]
MLNNISSKHVVVRRDLVLPDEAISHDEETALAETKSASQRHMTNGIVCIVGGGPGDPGLITVKGLNCLRRADVVLYDRLASSELLHETQPHAELIDVGKEPKLHRRSQAEINSLLIEKAREGKIVVRLKGGDPFVFGRGGEECQALAAAGVRYEVVPGVSSAIAVPAYAGIPVTQRGVTSSFAVVAGHTGDSNSDIDWVGISRIGTIVFLMGVEHMAEIVSQLVARGRSSDTPVAIVREGTTQNQLVLVGTLTNIVEKAHGIHPPAVLIVGEVVHLREQIEWFVPQVVNVF